MAGAMTRIVDLIREAGALGPLALYTVAMPAISVPVLIATQASWFPALDEGGTAVVPLYVIGAALLVGLSLIPTHAVSLVAGLLYGVGAGSAVAMGSVMLGAAVGYGALRPLVRRRALAGLERRPRAAAVLNALVNSDARRTIGLVALVRLSPVMPFAATNLLMASAGVGAREFLVGSLLGLAPRVIAVVFVGAGLSELDLSQSLDTTWWIVGMVATVVTLVVIGRAAKRVLDEELALQG